MKTSADIKDFLQMMPLAISYDRGWYMNLNNQEDFQGLSLMLWLINFRAVGLIYQLTSLSVCA